MYWNDLKNAEKLIEPFRFSKRRKCWKVLFSFFVFSFISGCATIRIPEVETIPIDRFPAYEMPDGSKIYPSSIDNTIPDVDILAINDDIKSLLEKSIKNTRNPRERLLKLTDLLIKKIKYDTQDDTYGVKTAQETFDTGTGNCLSFSNLFVATARYVGLRSRFSEIPTLPNWTRDGEILFFTRHIGAAVDIRETYEKLIQLEVAGDNVKFVSLDDVQRYYFSPSEFTPDAYRINTFDFKAIPDSRAFAQYYNNLGSKCIAEGKTLEAFRYFIKAIKTDPGLSYAWSNLGVIYKQNNQLDAAETAYLQGLAVTRGSKDTSVLSIMNNLANLYDITGEEEKAQLYISQVASFREKNPYYQYAAGRTAYNDSLFEESVGLFKKAIRLKDDEHLFYYGLALAYLKTGEIKKAETNINQAIKYSWNKGRKAYYQNVLDTIKNVN